MSEAGISNMDLDTFRLLISLLYAYSPAVLSRVICYNVHWLIRPVLKLIIKLIPAQVNKDILVLTGAQELEDYIDHDQLPHFLGGTRDDMKVNVPFENSRSMTEVSPERHNMTVAEAEKLLKDYRRNLSKVKKEVF